MSCKNALTFTRRIHTAASACLPPTTPPDFFVTYTNGLVEAIEVKHAAIRRLQRDYIYRRRLFIELYARPNGWKFTEYIQEDTP